MTSTGKLREKGMESFIVGLRTVQTLKANFIHVRGWYQPLYLKGGSRHRCL